MNIYFGQESYPEKRQKISGSLIGTYDNLIKKFKSGKIKYNGFTFERLNDNSLKVKDMNSNSMTIILNYEDKTAILNNDSFPIHFSNNGPITEKDLKKILTWIWKQVKLYELREVFGM